MVLEEEQQSKLIEVVTLAVNEVSKRLSDLLNKKVQLEFLDQADSKWLDLAAVSIQEDSILVQSSITEPDSGPIAAVVSKKDAWVISDLMMGGNADTSGEMEYDMVKESAFGEAMNQAFAAVVTKFKALKEDLDIDMPDPQMRLLEKNKNDTLAVPEGFVEPLRIGLKLSIRGQPESSASIEINSTAALYLLASYHELAAVENAKAPEDSGDSDESDTNATAVDFVDQSGGGSTNEVDEEKNLNLLMDIKMGLTVELGRSEMPLNEILKLAKGSIIELDRLAGEPVDLFVNNKLVARGEVVVIDDNFGLRVTQLAGSLNLAADMGLLAGAES